jgi:hypothetical protein
MTGAVVVHEGRFQAGPAWSSGLQPANYKLWVSSAIAGAQPPSVQAVIGDKGQNMLGGLVDAFGPTTPLLGHSAQLEKLVSLAADGRADTTDGSATTAATPPAGSSNEMAPFRSAHRSRPPGH